MRMGVIRKHANRHLFHHGRVTQDCWREVERHLKHVKATRGTYVRAAPVSQLT